MNYKRIFTRSLCIQAVLFTGLAVLVVSCAHNPASTGTATSTENLVMNLASTPLPVPPIEQEASLSCWATCAEMIMTYQQQQPQSGPTSITVPRQCQQTFHEFPAWTQCCDATLRMASGCSLSGWPQFPDWSFSCHTNFGHPLKWAGMRNEIDGKRPFTFSGSIDQSFTHMMVVIAYTGNPTDKTLTILNPVCNLPAEVVTFPFSAYSNRHDRDSNRDYYNILPANLP